MNADGERPPAHVGRVETQDRELTTPDQDGLELKTENSRRKARNRAGGWKSEIRNPKSEMGGRKAPYGSVQRPSRATAMDWLGSGPPS